MYMHSWLASRTLFRVFAFWATFALRLASMRFLFSHVVKKFSTEATL